MKARAFKTEVVLSVTTGIRLCDMADLYDLLSHMAGYDLFTHEMVEVSHAASESILK